MKSENKKFVLGNRAMTLKIGAAITPSIAAPDSADDTPLSDDNKGFNKANRRVSYDPVSNIRGMVMTFPLPVNSVSSFDSD
jgi:hypothetical protein